MGPADLLVLIVLGTSIWVLFDAPRHALSRSWAVGCILLWIVAFPWYLATRSKASPAETTGTRRCPECAEFVQEAARVCRFCGHRLAPPLRVPEDPSVTPYSPLDDH
jgi:4-amino-4-deoxy-L-arabinose transferase-like glycosyltransferase